MLEKLFESVDENVLTPELKQSLQESFNDAVETKSQEIADQIVSEKISALNEHCDDYKAKLEEEYNQMKINLKAENDALVEEYSDKFETLSTNLSNYMDHVVEEFVEECRDSMNESLKNSKADALCEAFSNFVTLTGVNVSDIVEARDESLEEKYRTANETLSSVLEEKAQLQEQLNALTESTAKNTFDSIVESFTKDMTILQANKFATRANTLDVEDFSDAFNKLNALKESVIGESDDADDTEINETEQKLDSVDERLQRFL